jgi:hypothetical protein
VLPLPLFDNMERLYPLTFVSQIERLLWSTDSTVPRIS